MFEYDEHFEVEETKTKFQSLDQMAKIYELDKLVNI